MIHINAPVQKAPGIKVLGVGGGGCNAVNYMYYQGIQNVDFMVCDTDLQKLRQSPVQNRVQIGKDSTGGLGAGSNPEQGKTSANETLDYLRSVLENNTKMLFIAAGMGGGTGTGAAPVIADLSRSLGILTVAIVTIPFNFEGKRRVEQALKGIEELDKHVDSLLIICNEKLLKIHDNLKLSQAFKKADDVLAVAARSIAEIITIRGFVNIDMKDVKSVMNNSGVALMGAGDASGPDRAMEAVKKALDSPLLNSSDIRGASEVLLNILYGEEEVTPQEGESIKAYLKELVGGDVDFNWGSGKDDTLEDKLRVVVIVTRFKQRALESPYSAPVFKVEEVEEEEELRLMVEDARQLEEKKRQQYKTRQEQQQRKEQKETLPREKQKQGKNTPPDQDGWLQRTFGHIFNTDANLARDTDISKESGS